MVYLSPTRPIMTTIGRIRSVVAFPREGFLIILYRKSQGSNLLDSRLSVMAQSANGEAGYTRIGSTAKNLAGAMLYPLSFVSRSGPPVQPSLMVLVERDLVVEENFCANLFCRCLKSPLETALFTRQPHNEVPSQTLRFEC